MNSDFYLIFGGIAVNTIGSLIAELRKEAGYTQKSLAEALNLTDKAISKWERGLSLPDTTLLPKLSVLLDVDIERLIRPAEDNKNNQWVGVLDCSEFSTDVGKIVYDKPMVYFLIMHFMLLGIIDIIIEGNKALVDKVKKANLERFGFKIHEDLEKVNNNNIMVLNGPFFLFGSDLTRQFQASMMSESLVKVKPIGNEAPFLFCPAELSFMYCKNKKYLYDNAKIKNLGRGMVCIKMHTDDAVLDVANFVRIYQENSGNLIGDLNEIAVNKGITVRDSVVTKPTVG